MKVVACNTLDPVYPVTQWKCSCCEGTQFTHRFLYKMMEHLREAHDIPSRSINANDDYTQLFVHEANI